MRSEVSLSISALKSYNKKINTHVLSRSKMIIIISVNGYDSLTNNNNNNFLFMKVNRSF